MAERLTGDQQIVSADRRAILLQRRLNLAGNTRIFLIEGKKMDRPGEESRQAILIELSPATLGCAIAQLEGGDRGVADRCDARLPAPLGRRNAAELPLISAMQALVSR